MSETATSSTSGGWITEQELARHLHISIRHMANLRASGMPHIRLGGSVRYNLAEIEAYLRGNRRLSSHVARQKRRAQLDAAH